MKQVTIQEVAVQAGVSRATVSRVLNQHASVDDDLRVRVEEAIKSLGYEPNRAARRLRANSSDVLGLLIPDIQNPVFVSVARGVEDEAYQHQLNVMLCNSDDHPEKQQTYLRILQAERAAGIIAVPTSIHDGPALSEIRASGVPVVLVDRYVDDPAFDMVKVDNVRGSYLAVKHLLDLGYERIAMITGLPDVTPGYERPQGYYEAMRNAGRPVLDTLIRPGDFKDGSGYLQTLALMALAEPPDAIFSVNGLTTIGVVRALRELGLSVPHDVALVGFDDMPYPEIVHPGLTVVAQPSYEIGQQAVQFLMRRRREPKASYMTVTFQPRLIVRESCGAYLRTKA